MTRGANLGGVGGQGSRGSSPTESGGAGGNPQLSGEIARRHTKPSVPMILSLFSSRPPLSLFLCTAVGRPGLGFTVGTVFTTKHTLFRKRYKYGDSFSSFTNLSIFFIHQIVYFSLKNEMQGILDILHSASLGALSPCVRGLVETSGSNDRTPLFRGPSRSGEGEPDLTSELKRYKQRLSSKLKGQEQ